MDFILVFIKHLVAFVHDLTGGNQWLATAVFAGLAFVLRRTPEHLYDFLLKQLTATIRVVDKGVENKSQTIDAVLLYLRQNSSPSYQKTFSIQEDATSIEGRLISGLGYHWVKILNCLILVKLSPVHNNNGETRLMTMRTAFWNRPKLKDILGEIYPQRYDLPFIYEADGGWFYKVATIPKLFGQQMQLIDDELYNRIDGIFDRFCNDADYYEKNQRLKKETFLLYGPPGTGKTNLFRHLASKYGLPVLLATPETLKSAIGQIKRTNMGRMIILLEDIVLTPAMSMGSLSAGSTATTTDHVVRELLNELAGVKPLDDLIIVMTTNYIDKIPKEVYRPGRVDHLIEVNYPSKPTLIRTIGFNPSDQRYIYLNQLEVLDIPLDNILSIRNTNTLEEVVEIIAARDNYLKLSLHSK